MVDRVGLILDIFAQRAQSFEGKLQVELAQLKHMSTRLVGGWSHLERQKGGIGLRGPGETQLESDRRLLQDRMLMLEKRLAKVRGHRDLSRKARAKMTCQQWYWLAIPMQESRPFLMRLREQVYTLKIGCLRH